MTWEPVLIGWLRAVLVALVVSAGGTPVPPQPPAGSPTVAHDALRTGWNAAAAGLSPAAVGSADVGRLWTTRVDGPVYAQPVVSAGVVIAATQTNHVYGIDAATGRIRWDRSVGDPWPPATIGCGDTGVNVGITSTPVVDPRSGTAYLTAKTPGGDVAHPRYDMHAVDVASGAERPGWPVRIQGAPTNDPSTPFDARYELQRPGLLLLDGVVYAAFGGMCGVGPYRGYVVGVGTNGRISTMWTSAPRRADAGAGIWQSGGGLVSDGPGSILLTTGNGVSDVATGRLAEAVVRLRVGSDGALSTADYFMPANTAALNQDDVDLGSGSPLALPSGWGGPAHPDLLVQVGKDGRVYLLDRDRLGGRARGPGGTDAALAVLGPYEGLWGAPAFYGHGPGYVYIAGSGGPMRVFALGRDAAGTPTLAQVGRSADTFPYTSGSPAVTSTGDAPGSGVVWEVRSNGPSGRGGQLRAYAAVPASGTLRPVFSADLGTAVKFAKVGTDGDRIVVGTRDGTVSAYGRVRSPAATAAPLDLGSRPVGSTATATVTIRATTSLTVSAAAATGPFATAGVAPTRLAAGATLAVPVTFTPTVPGPAEGELAVATDGGLLTAGLAGSGAAPGLLASAPTVDLGRTRVGRAVAAAVTFTNTGSTPTTVTGSSVPAAPFAVRDLPPPGTMLRPGAALAVTVSMLPAAGGSVAGDLVLRTGTGSATVRVTARVDAGTPRLVIGTGTVDLGSVAVGATRTGSFEIRNAGTAPLVITKAKVPTGAFSTTDPLAEGSTIAPGAIRRQTVTFHPTATGSATGRYVIAAAGAGGDHVVELRGSGGAATDSVPAPAAGGWRLNGGAARGGDELVLTPAAPHRSGSAVFPTAVGTDGLHATFTARSGDGSGGDGTTFAILDASRTTATARGGDGGRLGFGGLPGVAVALDTWANGHEPRQSVALLSGSGGGTTVTLARSTDVPSLRRGSHVVDIVVLGGRVVVGIDGTTVLDAVAPVPATGLLAFTAATGIRTDRHPVRDVRITTGSMLAAPDPRGWSHAGTAVVGQGILFAGPGPGASFPAATRLANGLHATFGVRVGSGGRVALAVLDGSRPSVGALGAGGAGAGFAGLPGVAIAFDPAAGTASVSTGSAGAALRRVAVVPGLRIRDRTFVVDVVAAGGRVSVRLDGRTVLEVAVPLPVAAAVGFTGTGVAAVSAVRIVAPR